MEKIRFFHLCHYRDKKTFRGLKVKGHIVGLQSTYLPALRGRYFSMKIIKGKFNINYLPKYPILTAISVSFDCKTDLRLLLAFNSA